MEVTTNQVLTPGNFSSFYKVLSGLRFPIKVADVLELRSVLNEAVDHFETPADSPSYREFIEALENAIHSFGVESRRHEDRLVTLLTLLREIHYHHSIASRDREIEIRSRTDEVLEAKTRSTRYGVVAMVAGIGMAIAWAAAPQAGWAIKALTLGSAYMCWDYFHSLPTLEREQKRLNKDLNDLLRDRITNVDWKMLIHKLSLLMGYKKVSGIEVFKMEDEFEPNNSMSGMH